MPFLGALFGQPAEEAGAAANAFVNNAAAVVGSAGARLGLVSPAVDGATSAGLQSDDDDGVEELFLEQRLDHFDRQDTRTFSQRYFINRRYV